MRRDDTTLNDSGYDAWTCVIDDEESAEVIVKALLAETDFA